MHISIRKVNFSEAETLLNLSRQTFMDAFAYRNKPEDIQAYGDVAFTKSKIESELNTEGSTFYFAMHGDDVTGYIKLNSNDAQTEFQDVEALEVERIYVLEKYQGNKIGEQLLNLAIATAKQHYYKYLWLGVFESNYAAIRFYERNGFEQFDSHYFMLGSDKQTDILMKLDLVK